jgi:ubiquinol-cytochrome c reductase cytochrome c subunit
MPAAMDGPQIEAKPVQFSQDQINQLAAFVASLGPGPSVPTEEQVDPSKGDPATGMALFRTNCAMCHNAVGAGGALSRGKFAPNLWSTSPTHLFEAMLTGPQSMPVFNNANLTPDEKRDIIAFIDQQGGAAPGGLDLGALGPVSEGLWAWVVGLGLLIGAAVWIGAKSS